MDHIIEKDHSDTSVQTLHNNDKLGLMSLSTNVELPSTYIQAATSHNTRKAYRQDIQHFIAWGGLLPATPDIIVRYLHEHAERLNARTLARRLTALKHWHTYQGFSDPTNHPLVKKTLVGIQNIHGRPKEKAPALTIEQLILLTDFLKEQDTLQSWRNNALLQTGFFGAFRRSELVNIQWEHISFVPEGMKIIIPRSKGDQTGEGQSCAIPYGDSTLCPVTSLKTWGEKADIQSGFIFRSINRYNQISNKPLTSDAINLIIKNIAITCNLPNANKLSGHSLRRGFATCASKKGAPFVTIMRHGRWRHERTVLEYIEEGQEFEDNVVNIILNNDTQKQRNNFLEGEDK